MTRKSSWVVLIITAYLSLVERQDEIDTCLVGSERNAVVANSRAGKC